MLLRQLIQQARANEAAAPAQRPVVRSCRRAYREDGTEPARSQGPRSEHGASLFENPKLPAVNTGLVLTFVSTNAVGDGMFALSTETGQESSASAFDAFDVPG